MGNREINCVTMGRQNLGMGRNKRERKGNGSEKDEDTACVGTN